MCVAGVGRLNLRRMPQPMVPFSASIEVWWQQGAEPAQPAQVLALSLASRMARQCVRTQMISALPSVSIDHRPLANLR